MSNLEQPCVMWTRYITPDGYGQVGGKSAHRTAYEAAHGLIPEGLEIDHLCRNRACVNPSHLEAVTHAENMRRAMVTHCVHGHEYTPENTYINQNGRSVARFCRTCNRAAVARYKERKRERMALRTAVAL